MVVVFEDLAADVQVVGRAEIFDGFDVGQRLQAELRDEQRDVLWGAEVLANGLMSRPHLPLVRC